MTDTIVLTIDNLGEAAEIEQGTWPAEAARGRHPSVTQALPRLLDLLDALALRATFFVEAINTREYPAALLEIAARGHEVGFHAWRHERWGDLDTDAEQDIIDRSFAAYAQLGLDVRAFRPPGGGLNRTRPAGCARRGVVVLGEGRAGRRRRRSDGPPAVSLGPRRRDLPLPAVRRACAPSAACRTSRSRRSRPSPG